MIDDAETRASADHPTARALIHAATRLFGRRGFDGTSTREIAIAAQTNVASISYHFGGKAELRTACALAITDRITAHFDDAPLTALPPPDVAADMLKGLSRRFLEFLFLQPQSDDVVAFMLREISEGGPMVDVFYERLVEPRHRAICQLWEAATGQPAESEATRLSVFSLFGQVAYFRIGAPLITRRMAWKSVGKAQLDAMADTVIATLDASIRRLRETAT